MNLAEIREYLGLPDDAPVPLRVQTGMRDVPVPHTDAEHIATFTAYLRCSKAPGERT